VVGDTPQDKMLELVNVLGFYDYEVLRYDTFIKHELIRHDAISSSKWRKANFKQAQLKKPLSRLVLIYIGSGIS
jgi:hypothetical protein